jgi:hypothetical protein
MISGTQIRDTRLGIFLARTTSALPQSTTASLFTITGGPILLTSIVGTVTTQIQAQATTYKLTANHATGVDVDLCSTLDLTGKAVGTLLGITGTFATALVGAGAGATVIPVQPVLVNVGTIDATTVASSTGAIQWTITYIPWAANAAVAVA